MRSISSHIMPLVLTSLEGGHTDADAGTDITHTHTYTHIHTDKHTHIHTHVHIHTLRGQDQFLETRCVSSVCLV